MSTRGYHGFVVDGQAKLQYNHSASDAGYLGLDILRWAREHGLEGAAREGVRAITMVDGDDKPSAAERERYAEFTQDVSAGDDWYAVLHNLQGDPAACIEAGLMVETWTEGWGYVVNLDTSFLEVYGDEYKPEELLVKFPLEHLPTDDDFVKRVEYEDGIVNGR